MKLRLCTVVIVAITITACGNDKRPEQVAAIATPITAGAFVQLFEWHWTDIATECENVLGPAGYAAVQISPPQEHVLGSQWWTRYQPVSYKIESRSGSRGEFAEMVKRCKDAGIDIYADAIINHMADIGSGTGVAGSEYGEFSYPVPYSYDDFHHCGRNEDGRIVNYQDQWEVQNCQLGLLADIDTSRSSVQAKIANYLDDLLSLGVTGFRMDAVKHIANKDVEEILALVEGDPFIFQEVIDRGSEPINARHYIKNGMVTEFQYADTIISALELGNINALTGLGTNPDWLPTDTAIVFVDNHDSQRSHLGNEILNYKDGARYNLAVTFMLAYPYGYPMVMSSYRFEDDGQGPPDSSPLDVSSGCGNDWVCEHRRPAITNMVAFRKVAAGTNVVNWLVTDDETISFGRGDIGHVVINIGEQAKEVEVASSMPDGRYCDVIANGVGGKDCSQSQISVKDDILTVSMQPLSAVAILAGD